MDAAAPGFTLRLVHADRPARTAPDPKVIRYVVNGWPAEVFHWTPAEWAALAVKPAGAQQYPDGSWGLLLIA